MEFTEFKGKTVDDAIMEASIQLGVASDELEVEVIEKGSNGFLGINRKQAVIKAKAKVANLDVNDVVPKMDTVLDEKKDKPVISSENVVEKEEVVKKVFDQDTIDSLVSSARTFLEDVFKAMKIEVEINISFDKDKNDIAIELSGEEMGILIGKRGQTLDSLQYLTSLYVNKVSESYVRVKLDTENYRERRKQTLEHLAKNIAYKVKRNRRPVYLEPMNPYERRIIHSALQHDKYVYTKSEGEEPYRKVVVLYKK